MNIKRSSANYDWIIFIASILALCATCFTSAQANAQENPIVVENQQSGSDLWELDYPSSDIVMHIKGFASHTSINKGEQVNFFVHVNTAQSYTIDVYRMGWYNGKGGRLMKSIGPLNGAPQPALTLNEVTGIVKAPWTSSYALQIPNSWTSGVYLAKLINSQGYDNYIIFVVRDDNRSADFLYQHAANTAQAYNNFPDDGVMGKSLYSFNSYGTNTIAGETRAVKVSFDRPYAKWGSGEFFDWEVYMVWWLEREGYDVTYSTDVELHANGTSLLNYKGFISAGHDEYWTKEMYDAAEAARDAGVNLAFMGSNAVFWQSRLQSNNRVLVSYKDASIDPTNNATLKTIKFRDLGRAEQQLIGVQYSDYIDSLNNNSAHVVKNSDHWVYSNTGFSNGSRVNNLVGYEIDRLYPNYPPPPANGTQVLLSNSPFFTANNTTVRANTSIYQASSGAWVFASGTMSWSWGLTRNGFTNSGIQQATTNIFERFLADAPQSNQLPTISNPGNTTSALGSSVTLQINAVDADGDTLRYSASNLPSGLTINANTGQIAGSPTAIGSNSVTVTVNDGNGGSASSSFVWTITSTTAACGPLTQEAERGQRSGAFLIGNSGNASGGKYVYVPTNVDHAWAGPDGVNKVAFCVTITQAGRYRILATSAASGGLANSFYVQLDGAPAAGYLWDTPLSSSYTPSYVDDRNGASPVEVSLSGGDHTIVFWLRETNTKLDKFTLELIEPTEPPEDSCAGLEREAEEGVLIGDFVIGSDSAASNGQYIHTPEGSGTEWTGANANRRADYCFTVTEAGVYVLQGSVAGADDLSDSFYVRVNNAPTTAYLWDTQLINSYTPDNLSDRGGPDPVMLSLSAGVHNISIYAREDGTRLDKLKLIAQQEPPPPPPQACTGLIREAEDGLLFGDFVVGNDNIASRGKYVHVPNGSGDEWQGPNEQRKVDLCFTVNQAGTYRINGAVYGATDLEDSFYAQVDGLPAAGYLWDTLTNSSYANDYVSNRNIVDPVLVSLSAGQHTVSIYLREDGTRLDKIALEPMTGSILQGVSVTEQPTPLMAMGVYGSVLLQSALPGTEIKLDTIDFTQFSITVVDAETEGAKYTQTVGLDIVGHYRLDSMVAGDYLMTLHVPDGYRSTMPQKLPITLSSDRVQRVSPDVLKLDSDSTQDNDQRIMLPFVRR